MKARINLFILFTAVSCPISINKLTGSRVELEGLDKNEFELELTTCALLPHCCPVSVLGFKSFEVVMEADTGLFLILQTAVSCVTST